MRRQSNNLPKFGQTGTDLLLNAHIVNAEQAIIGGLLIDADAWDKIADIITDKDFSDPRHQIIFKKISGLIKENKNYDVVTVSESLIATKSTGKNDNELRENLSYLAMLAQSVPSAVNIAGYAHLLRENAMRRGLVQAATYIIDNVRANPSAEIALLLDAAEQKILAINDEHSRKKEGFVSIAELGETLYEVIEERSKSDSKITGLATGYSFFDENTSGLQKGDLVIVAGRPGMGKTSFAMNIAEHVAIKEGKACAIFSLEMPSNQIAMRMYASFAKVNQMNMKTGKLTEAEWAKLTKALKSMQAAQIYIDDSSILTATEVRSRVRRLKRSHPDLALVVVDYLQLMRGHSESENRATEISGISMALKGLAKEMNVCIIALSQLNRQIESRKGSKPQLSDLRESGSLEQDADLQYAHLAVDQCRFDQILVGYLIGVSWYKFKIMVKCFDD